MKNLLTAYIIVVFAVIFGVFIFAYATHIGIWQEKDLPDRPQEIVENAELLDTDALSTKVSIAGLAEQYLGADSRIVTFGDAGIKRYTGGAENDTRCRMNIIITSNFYGGDYETLESGMSVVVTNPVIADFPAAGSETTLETDSIYPVSGQHVFDADAGLTLDLKTYNALVLILEYYSGNYSAESYEKDPLEGYDIKHLFIPTTTALEI